MKRIGITLAWIIPTLAACVILACSDLVASKGESRRLIKGGGVYLNNKRVNGDQKVALSECIDGKFLILRKGRKKYHLIKIVD